MNYINSSKGIFVNSSNNPASVPVLESLEAQDFVFTLLSDCSDDRVTPTAGDSLYIAGKIKASDSALIFYCDNWSADGQVITFNGLNTYTVEYLAGIKNKGTKIIIEIGYKNADSEKILLLDFATANPRIYRQNQPPPGNVLNYYTAVETDGRISNHNESATAHSDIRNALDGKVDKVDGKGLSTNDYSNEDKAKVGSLADVALSGSYSDLINKPLDRETVPMSITGYAAEGYPVARMDDVYDSIEIYKNAVGLAVVEMNVRSADNTITGDIVLIPVVNGVDGDPVTIAVTASWAKVSFALAIPAGTLAFRRDHANASDTLKDGASVVTAQVIEIAYRSTVL